MQKERGSMRKSKRLKNIYVKLKQRLQKPKLRRSKKSPKLRLKQRLQKKLPRLRE